MLEYKINDYLTLRLEDEEGESKTNIYVNGELFNQCKYLMLNIPIGDNEKFDAIESIDEAADILGWTYDGQEGIEYNIDSKTEFWGHCSNLQAWCEHNYDTRLLHSNLAFPLLKRLTTAGDSLAKRVFREEIAKRLASSCSNVITFLLEEGYDAFLDIKEIMNSVLDPKECSILGELEHTLGVRYKFIDDIENIYNLESHEYTYYAVKDGTVFGLEIEWRKPPPFHLPDNILQLSQLKKLFIIMENKTEPFQIPDQIFKMASLETLVINANIINLPYNLENLRKLKVLALNSEQSDINLPKSIDKLRFMESLEICSSCTICLPFSIKRLKNLKTLILWGKNVIIPNGINSLLNLTELSVKGYVKNFPDISSLTKLNQISLPKKNINKNLECFLKSIGLDYLRTIDNSKIYKKVAKNIFLN